MVFAKRNRRVGKWAALLAAYAFVLNALLATSLLAATPTTKSLTGYELCLNADGSGHPDIAIDKATKRAAVHCQICLQHAAPAALAPAEVGLPKFIPLVAAPVALSLDGPQLALPSGLPPPSRGPPPTTA